MCKKKKKFLLLKHGSCLSCLAQCDWWRSSIWPPLLYVTSRARHKTQTYITCFYLRNPLQKPWDNIRSSKQNPVFTKLRFWGSKAGIYAKWWFNNIDTALAPNQRNCQCMGVTHWICGYRQISLEKRVCHRIWVSGRPSGVSLPGSTVHVSDQQ